MDNDELEDGMSMNCDENISGKSEDVELNYGEEDFGLEEDFDLVEQQDSLDSAFDIVNMTTVVFDDGLASEEDEKQNSEGQE